MADLQGGRVRSLIVGSMYFRIGYKDVYIDFTSTINLDASYLERTYYSKQRYSPPWNRQDGILERKMSSNVSSNNLSLATGETPYFLSTTLADVAIGNGMAGIGTVVLFIFTTCVTYFGMMITFLSPVQH